MPADIPVTSNGRTPREHDLKVWPEFYAQLASGEKTFELRKDDRGFRAGDVLLLREWNPRMEAYTGNLMRRRVTYLMSGLGLQQGFVVMALGSSDETPTKPVRDADHCDYPDCEQHYSQVVHNALGCFEAAMVEGWIDALANGDIERVRDVWTRRLAFAHHALTVATSPEETSRER